MKLAVTVLASILFACSVTTANPVNPSATTSTDASTSTVYSAQTTPSVDLSKLSEGGINLIKIYIKANQDHEKAIKLRNLAKNAVTAQKIIMAELNEKLLRLKSESRKGNDKLQHAYTLERLRLKLQKQSRRLDMLETKYLGHSLYNVIWGLWDSKLELAKHFFKEFLGEKLTVNACIELLESNYEVLACIRRLKNEMLKSEQASTSGTQSLPRNYKSLSSKTPTDQPTQISSNTKGTFKVRSSTRKAYSKMKSSLGSPRSRGENDDQEPLI
ncbi:hypothetical protein O5D80_001573 [Batrachochytrium dendrobatidis]|nr:hypothetical protein O5D80_001573 [Batrachochytrium dendrobatidis]